MADRVAVIVHSDTKDHARGFHALLYAQELHQQGIEVQLIFDGAGTQWVSALADPKEMLHPLYQKVKEMVTFAACEFCSGAFRTKEVIARENIRFLGEFQGHPSIAKLVREGWQIITL